MGSLRSIPPIKNEGNAIGRMLVSVIDSLSKYHFVTISNWHPDLVKLEYNKSKYLHTKPIFSDRIYRYFLFLLPYKIKKYLYGYTSIDRIIYYNGIRRLIKKTKPDIIISHVHYYLFRCAKRAAPKSKHIFYFHSSNLGDWNQNEIRFLYSKADGIISICNFAFQDAKEKHNLTHPNTEVVYNGVDTNYFSMQKRKENRKLSRLTYGLNDEDIVILYAGRIHNSKGISLIIDAFIDCYEINKNLKLIIVGSGHSKYDDQELANKLIRTSSEIGGGIIKLIDWVDNYEMINIYALADISILASLNAEGNSLFIMESMACGLPVICTNVGGLTEIITNNKTGILVNKDNLKDELPRAIERLIEDEPLRVQLGENASNHIDTNLNLDIMSDKLDKYLQTFL